MCLCTPLHVHVSVSVVRVVMVVVCQVSGGRLDGLDGETMNDPRWKPTREELCHLMAVPTDKRQVNHPATPDNLTAVLCVVLRFVWTGWQRCRLLSKQASLSTR
jgi:hypothetical protein